MNGPNQNYGRPGQEFPVNSPLPGTNDANIDPLLNACTPAGPAPQDVSNAMDNQFLMGSAMWNPSFNNPISFYPSGVSDMAPTTVTGSPKPLTETQSSPRTSSSEPIFAASRTSSKSSIPSVISATVDTDTKPRRSSRGTKTQRQQSSAEPVTNPPRRQRTAKEPSLKEEEEDDDEDDIGQYEDSKRTKFLKRNRIAASKCRQKKKEWVSNLEDTRYGLENENSALHKQYNGLIDELSTIKTQLMQHASCNDANINLWLDSEAKKFVQRIATQNQAPIQAQPHNGTRDSHRRSSSVATSIPRSTIEREINYDYMPDSVMNSRP